LIKPPPTSFATRTLSTLKFTGFLGHTWMHAYNARKKNHNKTTDRTAK
jgi:cbb3-type cytochrome oxidase subunit 3